MLTTCEHVAGNFWAAARQRWAQPYRFPYIAGYSAFEDMISPAPIVAGRRAIRSYLFARRKCLVALFSTRP
jgi:hypothetical protein